MIYRLYETSPEVTNPDAAMTVNSVPQISFIFAPSNQNYQTFKKEVLASAELQDAEGVVMTQEQANEFIASLP